MANRADVVDIDLDPLAERTRRRRTFLRVGLPLGGVGLIIGFLLGIAIYTNAANRAGVSGLSGDLLNGLQERVALQVSSYLDPASHAVLLAQNMLGRGSATDRSEEARLFAASVLNETPHIANMLFADATGNFMLVTRAPGGGEGATETKRVLLSPAGRTVEWVSRNRTGAVTARRQDPTDTYDARARNWFVGARAADDVFWSGVYIFFSERVPGVTAAVRGPEDDPDVIGMDIRLDALSRFLAGLSVGRNGRAHIVSRNGDMIAGPDPARIMRMREGRLEPAHIAELDDADLLAAWDHYRVEGPGSRIVEVSHRRIIAIAATLEEAGKDWLLLITVPESDFSGFVTVNSRRAGWLSLIVVLLAAGLAVLLIRQGLRADRADRQVAERAAALQRQSTAFAHMATQMGLSDAVGRPSPAMTATLAEATGARRAAIWRLSHDGKVLRCEDSFEAATRGHVAGLELSVQEAPALVAALISGDEVDTPDARRDPRAAGLYRSWMEPVGATGLFAAPIRCNGHTHGAVMLEDAGHDATARDLVRACASLLALGATGEATAEVAVADSRVSGIAPCAEPTLDETVMGSGPMHHPADADADAVPGNGPAAVLVLRLSGTVMAHATAARESAAESLPQRIAGAAQEIARSHGLPYLTMLGGTIVAAAGLGSLAGMADDSAIRLADTAVALRQRCLSLCEEADIEPSFGLGLDAGPVASDRVGPAPGIYNLWGEALQGAQLLADTAPVGTIQASEQIFRRLRPHFVLRHRGLFHRPHIGDTDCYVLAGRV